MQPSGQQYPIGGDGYRAVITEVGATLRTLTHGERDLVVGFAADEIRPAYRGAVLAPWPNRIADGSYDFDGQRLQVPVNEIARNNALHGLVVWSSWTCARHEPAAVELTYRLHPQDGYPFLLDLSATYSVGADGLRCEFTAVNSGDANAPYGFAPHPYVVAGAGRVDDWTLDLPAERYLDVTPDRLLPKGLEDVAGTPFDFREPRAIGDTFIDHAFTGFASDANGGTRARLTTADGSGVEVRWSAACPWAQIHTADRAEPELSRIGLAVEPMTCPPDAFNSGVDLVVLAPGEQHTAAWTIAAV
ncbi:aldose 1-epimerase family protein [Flindersiella endophytica]